MAVLESFYSSVIFLILCDFAFINHGGSQEVYDYEANVKVQQITTRYNRYFKVDGKPPNAYFSILSEIDVTNRIYLVDYYINRAGKTVKLSRVPLCDQLEQNVTSYYLIDQIFFKFLFPRQRGCPVKQDKIKVPDSMEMKFNYGYIISSNITCEPWIYKQELRHLTSDRLFLSIIANIDMKKKYKCDPDPKAKSIWAKRVAEAQSNSTKGNT